MSIPSKVADIRSIKWGAHKFQLIKLTKLLLEKKAIGNTVLLVLGVGKFDYLVNTFPASNVSFLQKPLAIVRNSMSSRT